MKHNFDRDEAHDLIDQLTPEQIRAVSPMLRSMLPTPVEDEEISGSEKAAVAEADEWLKHNKPIPFEEVLGDFGLTADVTLSFERRSSHGLSDR
jgi:hypothetical protein